MTGVILHGARRLLAAGLMAGLCAAGVQADDSPSVSMAGNLRVECRGHGVPTVVAPAGRVHGLTDDGIVRVRRLCVFGTVARRAPGTNADPAQSLHTALIEAGAGAPWLVFGAPAPDDLLDAFARRFSDELAGVVRVPGHGHGTNAPPL